MAGTTSIISTPDRLSPVNDMWGNSWQFSNVSATSSNYTSFRYIINLSATTVDSSTYSFLVRENVPARPTTGYGLYSPYTSLLANLSYDFTNKITNATSSLPNSLLKYEAQYGIEYNPNQFCEFAGPTNSHFYIAIGTFDQFNVGDIINIQTTNPDVSGLSTIVRVITPNAWYEINRNFVTPTSLANLGGNVTDLTRWVGTASTVPGGGTGIYAFNGTRQYGHQSDNFYFNYVMGQSPGTPATQSFLTDYPLAEGKMIMSNQQETLNCFCNKAGVGNGGGGTNLVTHINIYNTSNTLIASTVSVAQGILTNELELCSIPVGTSILTSLLTASSAYYTVQVFGLSNTIVSELRTFTIDNSCSIYNNVRVMWLNSFGAWDYFNFTLDDHKSRTISRTEYKKILPFAYNIGDRQRTSLNQKITEQHIINTNWVIEDIYAYLGQLLISPEVYIIDETTGNPYPIVITDTSFDYKTEVRDQIFQLTLTYETSYDIENQNQ